MTAQLALAVLVLLLTPGPTNTLLALAGAERGWARAVRLIPAELAGYLATVVPLTLAGAGLLDRLPEARAAITLGAAAWVLWLAIAMWRLPHPAAPGRVTVTARRVAVTTLLNPKALAFGLVLLPAPSAGQLATHLAGFSAQVVVVAMAWAALGGLLARRGDPGLPPAWRRAVAVWLALLSAYLLTRAAA